MEKLELEIVGGRHEFEPGEEIELIAGWQFDDAPKSVELRVFWYTSGKGDTDMGVADVVSWEYVQPLDGKRFTLKLPDAPHSYAGKLIALNWSLELVALPGKQSTNKDIVIAPGGQAIDMQSIAAAADAVPEEKKFGVKWGRR